MTPQNTAPDAPLAIRVGVTGHRPGRLATADLTALRQRAREALDAIAWAAGDAERRLMVLSPLAEGADRIVAHAALEAGQALVCVLPFPRDDYLRDFSGAEARAEFKALLELADEVIELRGSRATPAAADAAYMAAGEHTVEHADVMLAIWDGGQARGVGGAGDVVALALDCSVPVVWIDAAAPHAIRLLTRDVGNGRATAPLASLDALLPR